MYYGIFQRFQLNHYLFSVSLEYNIKTMERLFQTFRTDLSIQLSKKARISFKYHLLSSTLILSTVEAYFVTEKIVTKENGIIQFYFFQGITIIQRNLWNLASFWSFCVSLLKLKILNSFQTVNLWIFLVNKRFSWLEISKHISDPSKLWLVR